MRKIEDAAQILSDLGLPRAQQNERSALTLLALAAIAPRTRWKNMTRPLLRVADIMKWMRTKYSTNYAPNTRETIRKDTIHQFVQARVIDRNPDDPTRPTTSPKTRYQLTELAADVIAKFGQKTYEAARASFKSNYGSLAQQYRRERHLRQVLVRFPNGDEVRLSPGAHNELQRQVVESFGSRFATDSVLLYLGDTENKRIHVEEATLRQLGIPALHHDKLPDILLFDSKRNWLFLVEAVTSNGPISPKRHMELEAMFAGCEAGKVYVTAFPDMATFKRYAAELVWESEVWIADQPDHMIHFNGDRFIGPHNPPDPNS